MMSPIQRLGILAACVFALLLPALWVQPASAATTTEIWTMRGHDIEGEAFAIAKIDLSTGSPVITVYGEGIHDPDVGDNDGHDWTTIAISHSRMLYLLRRLPRVNGSDDNVNVYSVPADSIHLHTNTGPLDPIPNNVVDNLVMVGTVPLQENLDGLCFGPDDNLYFTAASSRTSLPGVDVFNGLYRFRPSTGATEFVGSFKNAHYVGDPDAGTINEAQSHTVFYTDLAFDPVTGNLVGNGIDPLGKQTLYQIPGFQALTAGDATHPSALFDWDYFGGPTSGWNGRELHTEGWDNPDGIAFDQLTGDLYLSSDGQGVAKFNRKTAVNLGYIAGTGDLTLGFDLAMLAALIPPPKFTVCDVGTTELWPPNHNLVNVGLNVKFEPGTDPNPVLTITVYSNEPDLGPDGDDNFSPDAKDIASGTLRLRSERPGQSDGRVYLIVMNLTDVFGNSVYCTHTVGVPHDQSAASKAKLAQLEAAAVAYFNANNHTLPTGYVQVGGGPVVGPKQ